jgi:redox-sensitive bicupin YhaK (pirin superfamily)
VTVIIAGRERDLGGFVVRRLLPQAGRPMIGPFIFFDHLGPAEFAAGTGIDVRPHPHIALATVTYLFAGALEHRDSLGSVQEIQPGDVNWMTAGSGIVHSERTPQRVRGAPSQVHGIQSWVALPDGFEDVEPSFVHIAAAELPRRKADGVEITVVAGECFGLRSPVRTPWPTLYADVSMKAGAMLELDAEYTERAAYVLSGAVGLDELAAVRGAPVPTDGASPASAHCGDDGARSDAAHDLRINPGELAVFPTGSTLRLRALEDARLMLLGGERFASPRHLWWNFVASTPERIDAAKSRWARGEFPAVPGETEFIPLPKD